MCHGQRYNQEPHIHYMFWSLHCLNKLWVRPKKSYIYKSCEKSSLYYYNNVVIVCENCRQVWFPLGKDSTGERFPWGLPRKPRRGASCVCVCVCVCVGESKCVLIWWMACAWTQFYTVIVVSPIHFWWTGHFWLGTPQVYKSQIKPKL